MFKQRVLTSLILIPLILCIIYFSNRWVFIVFVAIMLISCGVEWLQLIPIESKSMKILFLLGLILTSIVANFYVSSGLLLDLGLWCLIFFAVVSYPKLVNLWGYPSLVAGLGLLVLSLFALSILNIAQFSQGRMLFIYLLFLVWATDIGAYFSGRQWGRHYLIPCVSPKKTYEGLLGGVVFSFLVSCGGYYYFTPTEPLFWFVLSLGVIFISMLGDLFISMLKRRCHLKDTGHLLPGHGGILDRLDSLIAAAPLFYAGLIFFPPGL